MATRNMIMSGSESELGEAMAQTKVRPSKVFIARLKELREARGYSRGAVARMMAAAGRPMSKLILLRIESGERGLPLDDALALADVLGVAPAHLLTPPDGQMVCLTDKRSVDGAGMRNFLRFGHPMLAGTPEGKRARLSATLEEIVLAQAQAFVDATHGGDQAGKLDALQALGETALDYRKALEEADDA
jgi:transcriptional regulator with XRE-family HTH domain